MVSETKRYIPTFWSLSYFTGPKAAVGALLTEVHLEAHCLELAQELASANLGKSLQGDPKVPQKRPRTYIYIYTNIHKYFHIYIYICLYIHLV